MNKELFMRNVDGLSENVPFFQQRRDATGRLGLSPLQKCTAAIRLLACGDAADTTNISDLVKARHFRVYTISLTE